MCNNEKHKEMILQHDSDRDHALFHLPYSRQVVCSEYHLHCGLLIEEIETDDCYFNQGGATCLITR